MRVCTVWASGREREKERVISVYKKKVKTLEIISHFYRIVRYIYLLSVFWDLGYFTLVDSL